MAFNLWKVPFVGSVLSIPATFLNKMRTEMAQAIDGAGGLYSPIEDLDIQGAGADIVLGGDQLVRFTPTGGTRVETAARFDSTFLLNSSAWPTFSGRNDVRWHLPKLLSDELVTGDIVGGTLAAPPNDIVVLAIPTQTAAGDFLLEMPEGPCQGAVLENVYIMTLGISGQSAGTLHLPTYQVRRVSLGNPGSGVVGALTNISDVVTDAHTIGAGNWNAAFVETTIPIIGPHAWSPQSSTYHIKVTAPWNVTDDAGMFIAGVGMQFTPTELRF